MQEYSIFIINTLQSCHRYIISVFKIIFCFQNFGTFQGRPSEEFIREARKNCPRVSDYTPPEGESQGMVRNPLYGVLFVTISS